MLANKLPCADSCVIGILFPDCSGYAEYSDDDDDNDGDGDESKMKFLLSRSEVWNTKKQVT